ncbi:MAG: hypothetical protein V4692_08580, partial [Bdellovibrionota bacterium]
MNSSRRIFFILRVFVATLFVAFQASVSMPAPFSFMHSRAFLVSMPAGSMYPNHCFSFTINSIIGGKQSNVVAATTINLTSTGTISFFSDFACSTAATTATIAAGASSVVVYMMATSTGSETITLTASAFKPQTQSRLVATNPFIWTGGAGTNTWATGANWSGGTAPNSTQIAFFDGNCVTFCSPMITASVGGIRMLSGFTGTVYQNTAGATTIGTSGFWQAAGTFEGSLGGDTLNLSGHFVLSGGTFKAPSGNLDIGAAINWRVSGAPTFTHNSGTIRNPNHFMGLSITPGSVDYFNVSILGRQNTVTNYGTWKIKGTLTIDSPDAASAQTWNLGTTEVGGDLIIKGQGTNGTALFKVNGSANQLIDGSTATNARISNLSIESTGGTVSLAGTIMILGDYKKLSGAMNGGTSTLYLENAWQGRNHTFGGGVTETYNNVTFTASNGSHTLTGEANISGTLTLNSTNAAFGTLDGGTLNVSGDLEGIGYGMRGST